jgi:hypothetical protein
MTNIRVREVETGKVFNLCPVTEDCCREVATPQPTTQSQTARPQSIQNESIEDWAERVGYPHFEKKVRLITRLPKAQTYDSYDVSDVEEIMERWPNRQIIGAFDINGEFQKAPAYTNPRATVRFVVLN